MLAVSGYSDDIIFLEGDLMQEFEAYESEGDYLAFSDGTVIKVCYDHEGIWRMNILFKGPLLMEKVEGDADQDTHDVVKFASGITWCVCGKAWSYKEVQNG